MRYKGENEIEFSRDDKKNVTVVLGDNTVGKTTIAQAFRWALYGEIINTRYDNAKKISLLNNEVLGDMTANDYRNVEVELILENVDENQKGYEYKIIRKATFVRKFPQLVPVQRSASLKMYVKDLTTGETTPYDNEGKDAGKVDELISELLPKTLSSYFLFDGERWGNEKETKGDIKDSIYNLVGISPVREMKRHLGECGAQGRSSVIKKLKSKITGSGDEYKEISNNIEMAYNAIEKSTKDLQEAEENAKYYNDKADEIEDLLKANPHVEEDQKECVHLENNIKAGDARKRTYYADIVTSFSSAHTYFAAPLLQDIIELLDGVELEGVDIPGVTDKTIYYLLEKHKCICGHDIYEGSAEDIHLRHLLTVVPPAVIGTVVGNFKNKISGWQNDGADKHEAIKSKAELYQLEDDSIMEDEERLERLQKKIDRKVNFANERKKMNNFRRQARDFGETARKLQLNIDDYNRRIEQLEKRKEDLREKSLDNERMELYIAYAEELYKSAANIFQRKEGNLLKELNSIIEKNFREMFNEQEKVAKLGDDYILRLYYKRLSVTNGYSDMEATGLSEGEKIARNFAFIVSILELAKRNKADGDDVAQSLPLVLDGPFSKLSTTNTEKVAKVLPGVSDQVIIFMLDKDWKASGLSKFTDPKYMYRTRKDINENSSYIVREVTNG